MIVVVRADIEDDYPGVRLVNERAFGRVNEAELVEALRLAANPRISMVAVLDGQVVGHIFFSPVSVESEKGAFTAFGLAPMAVLPEYQRRGIGSRLVRGGLNECQRMGHDLVFVLGHRDYYPRFGFKQADPLGFNCEYGRTESFMVAELSSGAAGGRTGVVKYLPPFRNV